LKTKGDAMGPVLAKLDHLVKQPTGCGEQNIVKFAPIVSVGKYLKDTQQLTDTMAQDIKKFIQTGYQRQLKYRHLDGSFSAFGPSNPNESRGGTWLTAFVLRSFAETFTLTETNGIISQEDINHSFEMLLSIQHLDGSFPQVGAPLFSKAMSGGIELSDKKDLTLSIYVFISLVKAINLTNIDDYDKNKIELVYNYIKDSFNDYNDYKSLDTFTLALTLYSFKLYDINRNKNFLIKIEREIDTRSVKSNDLTYWKSSSQEIQSTANLEITCYILLSKLIDKNNDNIEQIVPIAKWLNSQRNSLGGFHSTQVCFINLKVFLVFSSFFKFF
jgi:hypothetical protein